MKKIILFVLLALSARAEFNTERFLEALAMKETGLAWNGQPGPCGELSKWQITERTWYEEMGAVPFCAAYDGEWARKCTLARLLRIRGYVGDNPERIATCWHFGLSHRGTPSVWGQEVANLYGELAK